MADWFPAAQLAALAKAGVFDGPRSERWAGDKAVKRGWPSRKVECMGGEGGMRTEYQPPAEVLALIHAFLAANPDFFGKDKARAVKPAAAPVPAHVPVQPPNHAASPHRAYEVTPHHPASREVREDWLAIALDAIDYAMEAAEDRYVSPINKARLVKRVLGAVEFFGGQDGVAPLAGSELASLVRPFATLLVSKLPRVRANSEDNDYERTKERIRNEKEKDGGLH